MQFSDNGARVESKPQLVPDVYAIPLDVAAGPDGTLYITEWALFEQAGGRISY